MTKVMTEQEWMEGANPAKMVSFLRGRRASERKLRLFGCGCCRRVWGLLPDDASRQAVGVAERFADGLVKRKDLNNAYVACGGDAALSRYNAAATVVKASVEMAAYWTAYKGRCLAAGTEPIDPSQLPADRAATELEGRGQGQLLHDIFGNPFRPACVNPTWLTWGGGTLPRLAQAIYDERLLPAGHLDPARLAALGDALGEAGCADADTLSHCRQPGVHVRGCWVVDLILGKQ